MWRIKKLCKYLLEYQEIHIAQWKDRIINPKELNGVAIEELAHYISEKTKKTSEEDIRSIEKEIEDCISEKFFNGEGVWGIRQNSSGNTGYVELGIKGRKIINGIFIKRWAYFFQFSFEEHGHLYSFILGGGILVIFGSLLKLLEYRHQLPMQIVAGFELVKLWIKFF